MGVTDKQGPDAYRAQQLMARMGSRKFTPLPPDQHKWQQSPGEHELYRLWSWMIDQTVQFGHDSEYAVDQNGRALRLEYAARDLDMGVPNVHRAWRLGERRGLWRKGRPNEKGHLYLCGQVIPQNGDQDGETSANPIVCADNYSDIEALFPSYICKQIKELKLADDRLAQLVREEKADDKIEEQIRADFDAARRAIFDERRDARYKRYGITKTREVHKLSDPQKAAELEARKARVKLLVPLVAPIVEQRAQMFFDFAQSPNGSGAAALREPEARSAQNESESTQTAANSPREAETGFAQAKTFDPSLLYLEREIEKKRTTTEPARNDPPAEPPAPEGDDVVVGVAEKLKISRTAAGKFLANCREQDPQCGAEDILRTIDEVAGTINRTVVRNPTGVLLETVPVRLKANRSLSAKAVAPASGGWERMPGKEYFLPEKGPEGPLSAGPWLTSTGKEIPIYGKNGKSNGK